MQSIIRRSILAVLAGLAILTAVAVFDPSLLGRFYLRSGDVFIFPDTKGPAETSTLTPASRTNWREFSNGDSSRLAILLTDPASAWLSLAQGLKSIGVPFIVTDDWQHALRHRVVLAYPLISGRSMNAEALGAMGEHVRDGGTLIGINVLGGGLQEVFGFDGIRATREHTTIQFDPAHRLADDFTAPEEREIRIAATSHEYKRIGAHEYLGVRNPALATYANGAAAITWRDYSGGHAYAFGFDPGLLLKKARGYRLEGVAPAYVNVFEPTGDVVLRLIKRMYQSGENAAVTLHTVPWNKSLSVNITHDIDYYASLANSVEYARVERAMGVTATYFIQTKYVRDWNDEIFFNDEGVEHLRALTNLGMEIASHSVSHSKVFSTFPVGTGDERYPDYVPYVYEERSTYAGTVMGELRVSKFLLDRFSGGEPVVSFRAGYLENPFSLPQALEATGYAYDSTITANNALSHLPFRLNYERGGDAQVTVWEFPVTVEDERQPALSERLQSALDIAEDISRYGGNFVLLTHPNVVGEKLEFQSRLIEHLKPDAWFGSIGEIGAWWRARDAVQVDVDYDDRRLRVRLHAPIPLAGLTLELPVEAESAKSEPSVVASVDGNRIVLNEIEGDVSLEIEFRR